MGTADRSIAAVRVLGGVHALGSDGSVVDLPSASQRRLLAVLALHAPRRLRSEWLADLLEITPGALRTSVSRLRAAVGASVLQTASTGYSLVTRCRRGAVLRGGCRRGRVRRTDSHARTRAGDLDRPVLEEFAGEEWADGEIARVTELHAGTVDDYADELISARRSAEAVAALERQVVLAPVPRPFARALDPRARERAGARPTRSAHFRSTAPF